MATKSASTGHPGEFIRQHVIPSGMSVTEAARRLGIGRPALSNLLNGKSSLSEDMAARLQKAFGADSQKLAQLDAEFVSARRGDGKSLVVPA